MKTQVNKFKESCKMFSEFRSRTDLYGLCNWQLFSDNFILESWTSESKGVIIVQIWADGNGFTFYNAINPNNLLKS